MNYRSSSIWLTVYHFFLWILNPKFCLGCLLELIFTECSYNFSAIEIISNIFPRYAGLSFFDCNVLLIPFWSLPFSQKCFVFLYLYLIINLEFRVWFLEIFFLFFTVYSIYVPDTASAGLVLIVLRHVFLYLSTISSSLSMSTLLDNAVISLKIFPSNVLLILTKITDLLMLYVWKLFKVHLHSTTISQIYYKIATLIYSNLLWFRNKHAQ